MRSVAVLGVLAGCNQIYGLDPTKVIDAGPPPRHVSLTYLIAPGDVTQGLDLATAVRGVTALSATTLDGAQTLDLLPLYAGSAIVDVPESFAAQPWRLAYEIVGDVPREVQNPPAGDLHVVVPMFGPLDRIPIPMASGYSVTPRNFVGSHALHRVYTTGVWTVGFADPAPMTAKLDYPFDRAASLFGPIGAPNGPRDRVLIVDYKIDGATGCRVATGSTDTPLALTPNQLAVPDPEPLWDATTLPIMLQMDAQAALLHLTGVNVFTDTVGPAHIALGMIPSDRMPAFEAAPQSPLVLPGPVIAALNVCPWAPAPPVLPAIPAFHDTDLDSELVPVLHAEATIVRVVDGVQLVSGMAVVAPRTGTSYAPVFAAPTVMGAMLGSADLFGADEHVAVATAGPLQLSFTLAGRDDFTEVTLHQLDGTTLRPVRRYTVFGTTVEIDPGVFTPGATHVFEIRTFTGRPGAVLGDFRIATLPQAMVTMFTRTFVTP
jgi:hypothetical protein